VILPAELHDRPRALIGTIEDDYWRGTLGDDLAEGVGGNDSFWGNWGNDRVCGHSGDDYLSGGQGNETLIGGKRANTLNGGEGSYIARYDDSDVGVTIDLAHGETHGGDAEGDGIYGIEGLIGSIHDDILKGDSEDNYLCGTSRRSWRSRICVPSIRPSTRARACHPTQGNEFIPHRTWWRYHAQASMPRKTKAPAMTIHNTNWLMSS
jgi:hypothetical protein